ncbi:SusD/RagB family nutrient-binding outer membrane lipoprotein [Pedobacter sp. PAMC26386]|nr:SusD/RagB family nutrient-binding outer membrane lipoprotein [Pedobacter sp. PAMC26386]
MKKTNLKYNTLILSAVLLLSFGCKKTLDVNTDPNNPLIESATPEVLFPSAVLSTAGRVGGELTILGGMWSQYFTQANSSNQYKSIDSYNLTKNDINGNYQELFAGALADYQLALSKAQTRSDWRYNLMATVMKAYTFEILVDLYDKVPYTEAFQGKANLQPKFDDGDKIYTALLGEIDAALAKDYRTIPLTAKQQKTDFLFNGDMELWTQFANTLKLKMYLRMINANPAAAQAGIAKLYQSGATFLSINAGIAKFDGTPDNSNPFYEYNIRRLNVATNIRASVTFSSWLVNNGDPRAITYFGTANPTAIHQGDFSASAIDQPTYANATVFSQKATDPVWFITTAESYFMQAEALERYFGGTGAKAMYDLGLAAAFKQSNQTLSPDLIATYAYPTGTLESKVEAIITQKWASFPGSHDLEAFFEQQRTGYPKISAVYSTDANYVPGQLVYAKNGVTPGKQFPRRLVFPASSVDRNKNAPALVPITTKVWWAK